MQNNTRHFMNNIFQVAYVYRNWGTSVRSVENNVEFPDDFYTCISVHFPMPNMYKCTLHSRIHRSENISSINLPLDIQIYFTRLYFIYRVLDRVELLLMSGSPTNVVPSVNVKSRTRSRLKETFLKKLKKLLL